MNKYIFTFGYDDGGGWAEVFAENKTQAIEAFSLFHPRRDGFVACCTIYTESEFKRTHMCGFGNFNKRCVERITIERTIIKEENNHDQTAR